VSWARQFESGNPERVMERRQEPPPTRSCAGCVHIRLVESQFDGRRVLQCAEGLQVGQRCRLFQERGR